MQCPACQFENMPGEERCVRCQALLAPDPILAGDTLPPRARNRYSLRRRLQRRWNPLAESVGRWWKSRSLPMPVLLPPGTVADGRALGLSLLLPGLGQWRRGRRRPGAGFLASWLMCLLNAVNLYPFGVSALALVLGVVLHALAAAEAGGVARIAPRRPRSAARALALLVLPLALLYLVAERSVRAAFEFPVCGFRLEASRIAAGDTLVARRQAPAYDRLRRGDTVTLEGRNTLVERGLLLPNLYVRIETPVAMPAVVLALAGDEVRRQGDQVLVNGLVVAPQGLPDGRVPDLEALSEAPFLVPPGHLYAAYPTRGPGGAVANLREADRLALWHARFILPAEQLRGRAVAVYQPMTRRHLLRHE